MSPERPTTPAAPGAPAAQPPAAPPAGLGDTPPALTWPADRVAPQPLPEKRPTLTFDVPREITDRLAVLAREGNGPALATLTAGLQALLYRVASPWENAGTDEVVVGAGQAGSWLPLRQTLDPHDTFAALTERVASGLREGADTDRSAGEPDGAAAEDACRAAVLLGADDGPPLDLVFVFDPENGYHGSLSYDGLSYSPETAERIAVSYLELLRAATTDGSTPIGLLPLVPQPPRTVEGAGRADDATTTGEWDVTVQELFDRAAARHPDTPALRWDDGELTYAELKTAADRWAAHIGTARAVALSGPRCPELVVALLAILKSGAGYVPIDPAYPRERLDHMLEDSRADVLIRPADADGAFAVPDGVRVIDLDDVLAAPPDDAVPPRPASRTATTDLCYVIYTSGSTGLPKGVGMPHRPLTSLLDWQFRHSAAGPGWTTLQFAAFSFDVAFQEMFATWGTGGTLLLVADDVRRDPDRLAAHLADEAVHRLFLPFVALQQLAEASLRSGRHPSALREVVTAGEQLHISPAVREFFRRTGAALENQYGPSETHVVTAERLSGDPADWPELPAIGRPVDRASVEILDERLQHLPDGVPGEICVSGVSLADGYVGRPDLTAERFVDRVLTAGPDGAGEITVRTYRTGDYGTRAPDGRIQYLGRRDGQVKIRGFRVELGEVEACVKAQEGLAEAIVVVQETPSDKRIIAYYLLAEGHDRPPHALRGELAQILPGHMVPFACVALTRLPLTPSGKADRRALAARPLPEDPDAAYEEVLDELGVFDEPAAGPDPVTAGGDTADDSGTPETPFEEVLVEIWADALARDTIGRHTDLFALGAESATALQVAAQVGDIFRLTVPVRVLFDRPTPAGQAAWLAAHDAANDGHLADIARLLLAYDAQDPVHS